MRRSATWAAIGFLAVCLAMEAAAPARSATIGYWRMEDTGNLGFDSSGNGNTLINNNVAAYALPGTGPGSKFSNPIPQTGAANLRAGDFSNSTAFLRRADGPWIDAISASGEFTAEAFFHQPSLSGSTTILAQYDTTGNQRSFQWQAKRGTGSGNMNVWLAAAGNSGTEVLSSFIAETGRDYYAAVTVKLSGPNAGVTFYWKDLTNNGPLFSETQPIPAGITALHNSTADFYIGIRGGTGGTGTGNPFNGYIDEVRLSSVALGPDALLINVVPEPATWLLLLVAGALLAPATARLAGKRRR